MLFYEPATSSLVLHRAWRTKLCFEPHEALGSPLARRYWKQANPFAALLLGRGADQELVE